MKLKQAKIVVPVTLLALAGIVFFWRTHGGNGTNTVFHTVSVTRGDVAVTIAASGTLEPEEVVDVGAQVGGQIVALGKAVDGKSVDYASKVEKGAVLAQIDEALIQADVKQAEAGVKSAQAGVQKAEADLEQLKAKLAQTEADAASAQAGIRRAEADLGQLKAKRTQAQRDWDRAQRLGPSDALSQATYDSYQSASEAAQANVAVGEAALLQARSASDGARSATTMASANVRVGEAAVLAANASLAQAETSLWRAKRNLGYCTITSPVDGVIIDRRVNIGQTVNASMDAPSLFLIAKDLRRMQVWVAVNEADVARIYAGQPVSFTVDALPEESFRGSVSKVRLNASMTQNVVTYTAEIVTDNPDGRLLPYLTANVRFEVKRSTQVLQVPAAALRWIPSPEQIAPAKRPVAAVSAAAVPTAPAAANTGANGRKSGVLWVVDGAYVCPIAVHVGLSDGTVTEVAGDGLTEGLAVVTGTDAAASVAMGTTNPFTVKLPKPPRGGPPPG